MVGNQIPLEGHEAACDAVYVRTKLDFFASVRCPGVVIVRVAFQPVAAFDGGHPKTLAIVHDGRELHLVGDRHSVRDLAAEEFDGERIVDSIITAVDMARLGGGIETAACV